MGGKSLSYFFLLLGVSALVFAYLKEGGAAAALLAPTAFIIIAGGTIAATGLSFPMDELRVLPGALKATFNFERKSLAHEIIYFKEVSAKTRSEGLLAFDKELGKVTDAFLKKGLRMVVDGFDSNTVRAILEQDLELTTARHKVGAEILESAGGYSPTMGVVGTVMGLVNVLSRLSEPDKLGSAIAMAFLATLYGVAFANLWWLPLGAKMRAAHKQEMYEKQFYIEAILLIQEGANTFLLVEKLKGFLERDERAVFEKLNEKKPH
jgi:chemotaxis protein MotA